MQSKAVWRSPTYCCVPPPEALRAALPRKRLSVPCFAMPCRCTSSLWAGLGVSKQCCVPPHGCWTADLPLMVLGRELRVLCSAHHKASKKEKKKKVLCRQKGIASEDLDLHHTTGSLRAGTKASPTTWRKDSGQVIGSWLWLGHKHGVLHIYKSCCPCNEMPQQNWQEPQFSGCCRSDAVQVRWESCVCWRPRARLLGWQHPRLGPRAKAREN